MGSPSTYLADGNSAFSASPTAFTGLQPRRCRAKTALLDSALIKQRRQAPGEEKVMSTIQSTYQHTAIRTRVALLIVIAGAVAALAVALIPSNSANTSSASSPSLSRTQAQQQLDAVNGARFRVENQRPSALDHQTPQQQLQSVAGARFGLNVTR
jgi:hypothetical protein